MCACGSNPQGQTNGAAIESRSVLRTEAAEKESETEDTAEAAEEERAFFAMNTYMRIRAYDADTALMDQAEVRVEELEALFSTTREESEIAILNRDKTAALSGETEELMRLALSLCERTEGALDISVYPVVRSWGFTTGEYRIPERAELDTLLRYVDYRNVKLEKGTALIGADMMVDLGSVGKGYTGDQLAALLKENGVQSALLDLGGNIQTVGRKPDGSLWKIGIKDPKKPDSQVGGVSVEDEAVITSGGYERYFTGEDGEIYWHIIDPATGEPAHSGLLSVTIIGKSGALCDALSTSLFVMGLEGATEQYRTYGDFEAVLVAQNGTVYITEGLRDRFTLAEGLDPDRLQVIEK